MANTYDIRLFRDLPAGPIDFSINEKQIVVDHGITFTGRGVADYGEHRNANLLHLTENFASLDAGGGNPAASIISNPLTGQLWFDKTANQIRAFNGTIWTDLTTDDFMVSNTYVVVTPSWLSVMTVLDPTVWYKLDESSGDLINSGSEQTASLDLTTGTVSGYSITGVTPATVSQDAIAFRSNSSVRTASGNGFGDINTSSPANSGSWVVVFRNNFQDTGRNMIYEAYQGFDNDGIGINITAGGFRCEMQNGPGTPDEFMETATEAACAGISSSTSDGNWHMIAWTKTGSTHTIYYDGSVISTSNVTGGNITAAFWIDNFTSADEFRIGARGDPSSQDDFSGHVDEVIYFDGTVLTTQNVIDLWNTISINAVQSARGAKESVMWAMREEFSGMPEHAVTLGPAAFTQIADFGSAATRLGAATQAGGTLEAVLGWSTEQSAIGFDPASYVSGDAVRFQSITGADFRSHTTGFVMFMFRISDVKTWNMDLWMFGDSDITFEQGEVRFTVQTQGGGAGQIQFAFKSPDASTKIFFFQGHNSIHDLTNGNWHQLIMYQPANGNGLNWYVDGIEYLFSDPLVIEGGDTSTYDNNVWFDEADADIGGSPRLSIGSFSGNSTPDFGLFGEMENFVIHDGAMTAAIATRLWNATGL